MQFMVVALVALGAMLYVYLLNMAEGYTSKPGDIVEHLNPSSTTAIVAGTMVQVADGRMGLVVNDIPASRTGSAMVRGIAKLTKAASDGGVSAGQLAYWNDTTNVVQSTPTAYPCGIFIADAATALVVAYVALNELGATILTFAPEIDCETDTDDHILVPAVANRKGLVMLLAYGVITEAFAGAAQDQGIITISDQSDNALATLTVSDGGVDAIGDVVIGTNPLLISGTTGDAIKTIAASEYIDAACTQQPSGAGVAGKIRPHILVAPLV